MKKRILVLFMTLVLLTGLAPVHEAQAILPTASWWGTFGLRGYPTQATSGYVYASVIGYQFSQVGYYTISGDSFIGPAETLTTISGTCFIQARTNVDFSAMLTVDDRYLVPLFEHDRTADESVAPFNITVVGKKFTIKITTIAPIGCNILLENKA